MKDTKGKNAAQWGTWNWICTFPWSKMDRKRRKRAERAVGEEVVADLKRRVHTCCLMTSLEAIMDKYGVGLPRDDMKRLERALLTVSRLESELLDSAFAHALARAWGIK